MLIRKECDVGQLSKELTDRIDGARIGCAYLVSVPLDKAVSILDVLQETLEREKKHQALESALTFMEMEDGTRTNEMEKYNAIGRPDCFAPMSGCPEVCEECEYSKGCVYNCRDVDIGKAVEEYKRKYDVRIDMRGVECNDKTCVHCNDTSGRCRLWRVEIEKDTGKCSCKEVDEATKVQEGREASVEIETKTEQLPECIGRYDGADCTCLNGVIPDNIIDPRKILPKEEVGKIKQESGIKSDIRPKKAIRPPKKVKCVERDIDDET